MSVLAVVETIASILGLAADLASKVGDVVTAKRVEAILDDRFPGYYKRAAKAGEAAKTALDDRLAPGHE
jgi:hypothetical protein